MTYLTLVDRRTATTETRHSTRARILIVEDNADSRTDSAPVSRSRDTRSGRRGR